MAQGPAGSLLQIDIRDHTLYALTDVESSKLGKNLSPGPIPASPNALYGSVIGIGDIVAVNGIPAKGTVFERVTSILSTPAFTPGQTLADVPRNGFYEWMIELMNPDGTLIGSVIASGMAGSGPPPPGAPSVIARAGYVVVGGTGPFLGARGYFQSSVGTVRPVRIASAAEDPAYRRVNGGGAGPLFLYLLPASRPEVLTVAAGPAVVHSSDDSLVNAARPAKSGEILTLFASGLGPTRPGVEPGQPYTANPTQVANSPVQVLVNGRPGEVLFAGGYPGATDGYQVNFRVPDGIAPGIAAIQLTAAWIAGPSVNIPVQ